VKRDQLMTRCDLQQSDYLQRRKQVIPSTKQRSQRGARCERFVAMETTETETEAGWRAGSHLTDLLVLVTNHRRINQSSLFDCDASNT